MYEVDANAKADPAILKALLSGYMNAQVTLPKTHWKNEGPKKWVAAITKAVEASVEKDAKADA